MRVLLTGASSFTGSWFARELVQAGHHVVAVFRGQAGSYEGGRGARVKALEGRVEPVWGVEFGDTGFLEAAAGQDFDMLLHHAAEMTDYRSWDFDAVNALAKNTRSGRSLLTALSERGCAKLVLTGSVFEPYEGVGDGAQRAFSPYGLSKHLTFEWFRLEAEKLGLSVGKFVVPNPFGPQEEFRYTSYLAKAWAAADTPTCAAPVYVRDNIHVTLLAKAYVAHCEALPERAGVVRANPSGYIESQGAFTHRLARELRARTGWACEVREADQQSVPEPLFRANNTLVAAATPGWSEHEAWNELASYYQDTFG